MKTKRKLNLGDRVKIINMHGGPHPFVGRFGIIDSYGMLRATIECIIM